MHAGANGGQKRVLELLALEFQVTVSAESHSDPLQ